jgi:glycosyltransferase involved in cell wall biosynthesis
MDTRPNASLTPSPRSDHSLANSLTMRICSVVHVSWDRLPPAHRLVRALRAAGHEVDVILSSADGTVKASELPAFVELIEVAAPHGPMGKVARELDLAARMVPRLERGRYDLIIANNAFPIPWVARASARNRKPWVYHAHELILCGPSLSPGNAVLAFYEKILAKNAALVVAPEIHRARVLRRALHLSTDPMVLPNVSERLPLDRSSPLRARLAAAGMHPRRIVLFSGGIGQSQTFVNLVASVALWPEHSVLVMLGWGDPASLEQLRQLAAAKGVADRVLFIPPVTHAELWPYICDADVGLVLYEADDPSTRYAAPNKLGEYIAAAILIAYFPVPSMRRLLRGQAWATSITAPTVEGIGRAVREALAGSEDQIDERRREVRRFFDESFNFESVVAPVVDAIEALGPRRSSIAVRA